MTLIQTGRPRRVIRGGAALLFVSVGLLHFISPATYIRIVPPALPNPALLVIISGVAEIVGGLGLLIRPLRPIAVIGLILLLVAVFPANIYMALYADRFADLGVSPWMLWARLPFQFVLIAGVWWMR